MVVNALPVASAAPPPVAKAIAPVPPVFTGMLQQLLTELAPPLPVPATPIVPVVQKGAQKDVQKDPGRAPVREHHEPPSEDVPAPPPQIHFLAIAPVTVPIPSLPTPPPSPTSAPSTPAPLSAPSAPAPAPPPRIESDPPAPVAVDLNSDAALIVAVRNADAVKTPEVKEIVPEHHDEIPESAAPEEPARALVARPALRVEAPKPVAAAAPPDVQAEKSAPQPVRSVALDLSTDGAHDVRVRLAEHAGEVHVSVHSADPVVTQNLQEGVTGLAATLAQAGYDARAWTPDRGQGQQQPREERAAKREKRAADTKFDGALEEVSR